MESITVDGYEVKLLKPISLARIIKCGNLECAEFRENLDEFEDEIMDQNGERCHVLDRVYFSEQNVKTILARPKWKDFLVQHGFISVERVEPEFELRKGDVITIGDTPYMITATDLGKVSLVNIKAGTRWSGPRPVDNNDNISLDEFKSMLGSEADGWRSIYATKCRVKDIVMEKV